MAVVILNVSEEYGKGTQVYELRINHKVLCTFEHTFEDGLSECLRRAAEAWDGHSKTIRDIQDGTGGDDR